MAASYHLQESVAMPVLPITGQYLARNQLSRVRKAFLAADLKRGIIRPTELTIGQAADLARVNYTTAWWAIRRYDERFEIEAGLIPLVPATTPAAPVHTNGNGTNGATLPIVPDTGSDDAWLVSIAQHVGQDRMLAAAVAASH
jgi:hypothetical protein